MKTMRFVQSLIGALLILTVGTVNAGETDIVTVTSSANALSITANFDAVAPMQLRIQCLERLGSLLK